MAAWKQIVVALVVVGAAAAGWAWFFPGASNVLARWGLDWAQAAAPETAAGGGNAGAERRRNQGSPQQAVVAVAVKSSVINDRLSAIGTGRANRSVTVNPFDSGRLTEIAVVSGSVVQAGTVIARLDSEAEEIALDRARFALSDAQVKLDRINALRSSNTASAVQQADAELALENARLALRDAELTLERRSIVAPIAGIVGIIPVSVGNNVTTSTEIATIDDRSRIVVDFWVPERYAGAVVVGEPLAAVPIARPSEAFEGSVSAVDNRIDEASRTLRVQAELENPGDTLRAGMSFQVTMRFPGDRYPSVDPLAIQWGSDGAFVWVVREGKAERTPVRIVQRNTESVLVEAELVEGELVVTEGVHAVREGGDVLIAGREDGAAGNGAAPGTIASGGS